MILDHAFTALFIFLIFLFLQRNKIDTYFVAACGFCIYYFPVFFDLIPEVDLSGRATGGFQVADATLQVVILIVMSSVYLFSLVHPSLSPRRKESLWCSNDTAVFWLSVILALLVTAPVIPAVLATSGKTARVVAAGGILVFIQYLATLALFFALCRFTRSDLPTRARLVALAYGAIFCYISIFIFQIRSMVLMPILAVMLFRFYGRSPFSVFRYGWWPIAVSAVILTVMGKHLANYFLYGVRFADVALILTSSVESFGVTAYLNTVFSSELAGNTLPAIMSSLIPFVDLGGADYHAVVRGELFPYADFGMGGNPIGEAWINGGYFGVAFLAVYVPAKCWILDRLMISTGGSTRGLWGLVAIFSLLYFGRNAIATDISFIRNFVGFYILICSMSALFHRRNVIFSLRPIAIRNKRSVA